MVVSVGQKMSKNAQKIAEKKFAYVRKKPLSCVCVCVCVGVCMRDKGKISNKKIKK